MPDCDYIVREAGDGWGVYARRTGEPVRLNGRVQTGLAIETATGLVEALSLLTPLAPDRADEAERETTH
ncbi:hypothetical protein [Methylobacterium sp. JK268]